MIISGKTITILSVVVAVSMFIALFVNFYNDKYSAPNAKAAAADNMGGFAWSENIGWISFNSTNCDVNGNGTYEGAAESAPASCPTSGAVIPYGVNLDIGGTNNLSGYAWSENIGWISFQAADVAGCPAGVCQPRLIGTDFYGWARALSFGGGWDGWISLNCANSVVCGASNYKISLNGVDFEGWAWGGDVVGWISFNCINSGVCGVSNYKVYLTNNNPTASNLAISDDYCALVPVRTFSWNYNDSDGDDESQFQLQIDDNSDFSSPEVNVCGIGNLPCSVPGGLSVPSGGVNFKNIDVMEFPGLDQLGYNKTYYWRVKVWDSVGGSSGWIEYDPDANPLTQNPVGTPLHPYPNASFTCSPDLGVSCPINHDILELITFGDDPDPGADPDRYGPYVLNWNFCKNTVPACAGNIANGTPVSYTYTAGGSYDVELKATDNDGYVCTFVQTLNIANARPKWNEINP